jgi:hypothetical protein
MKQDKILVCKLWDIYYIIGEKRGVRTDIRMNEQFEKKK